MSLLALEGVVRGYRTGRRMLRAVEQVTLGVDRGQIVGLVGESGSGKSTLARLALRLLAPESGVVRFEGRDVAELGGAELKTFRRRVQIVFQDPAAALNPRASVRRLIGEPLSLHRIVARAEVAAETARLMALGGLPTGYARRRPRELSGGERQRVALLRALASRPEILVCDEPVAALDVSVRAQIVNLLLDLRRGQGLGILFISHDLALVRRIADRLAVMYRGRIVEQGPSAAVWLRPSHPYTRTLLAALPRGIPGAQRRRTPPAAPADAAAATAGCSFRPLCPYAIAACAEVDPGLAPVAGAEAGHAAACLRRNELG